MSQRFNLVEGRKQVGSYYEPAPGLGYSDSDESEEEDIWQHRWVSSGVHEVRPRNRGDSRVLQADFEYVGANKVREDEVIIRGGRKGRKEEEEQRRKRRQGLLAVGFLGIIKGWSFCADAF
eukprot:767867-Hanusia_phi.AAC.1